jgi:hypothetical protein
VARVGIRVRLVAVLFLFVGPTGLLGLSTAPAVRQFFCDVPRKEVGPDWLVKRGPDSRYGTSGQFCRDACGHSPAVTEASSRLDQGGSVAGSARTRGRPPAWKQAGVCGLEFIGGSTGTAVASIVPIAMISVSVGDEDKAAVGLAAFPMYAVTSALLSAGGTYLVGKLLGQRGSFWHALAGGGVGGLGGSIALFSSFSSSGRAVLLPVALAAPSVCSVISYNVWRNNGTK